MEVVKRDFSSSKHLKDGRRPEYQSLLNYVAKEYPTRIQQEPKIRTSSCVQKLRCGGRTAILRGPARRWLYLQPLGDSRKRRGRDGFSWNAISLQEATGVGMPLLAR